MHIGFSIIEFLHVSAKVSVLYSANPSQISDCLVNRMCRIRLFQTFLMIRFLKSIEAQGQKISACGLYFLKL